MLQNVMGIKGVHGIVSKGNTAGEIRPNINPSGEEIGVDVGPTLQIFPVFAFSRTQMDSN
jgi:hypothetical protein